MQAALRHFQRAGRLFRRQLRVRQIVLDIALGFGQSPQPHGLALLAFARAAGDGQQAAKIVGERAGFLIVEGVDLPGEGVEIRPSAAAQVAVNGKLRRIPLGRIEYEDFTGKPSARYFTVAAGIGVDAHLFYKLTSQLKNSSGMAAYYLKAWQLWATYNMRRFEVEYSNGSGHSQRASLTELLAVRIKFFGNVLRELVPGASLDCNHLRAVMCRTASRNAYLQYVAGALLGRQWNIDGIDLVSCSEVVCKLPEKTDGHQDVHKHDVHEQDVHKHKDLHKEARVYVEADGELLGRLPARMTMVPDALSLVVPA